MEFLHKEQKEIEGKCVNFVFVEDADLKKIIVERDKRYFDECSAEDSDVVFIGYPSYNSIISSYKVCFPQSILSEMFPIKQDYDSKNKA